MDQYAGALYDDGIDVAELQAPKAFYRRHGRVHTSRLLGLGIPQADAARIKAAIKRTRRTICKYH